MINKKILLSIGSGLTVLTGLIAFTTAPSFAQKKPAIEVVTHAGAAVSYTHLTLPTILLV